MGWGEDQSSRLPSMFTTTGGRRRLNIKNKTYKFNYCGTIYWDLPVFCLESCTSVTKRSYLALVLIPNQLSHYNSPTKSIYFVFSLAELDQKKPSSKIGGTKCNPQILQHIYPHLLQFNQYLEPKQQINLPILTIRIKNNQLPPPLSQKENYQKQTWYSKTL